MAIAEEIPTHDLYGDPERDPVVRYCHVEPIRDRAGGHGWRIAPHRHADLAQIFLVLKGGGELSVESRAEPFVAPWILWLPPGTIHGFSFRPNTDGWVVTLAADFLLDALGRQPAREFGAVLAHFVSGRLPDTEEIGIDVAATFAGLAAELRLARPAARAAIAGHLGLILAALTRLAGPEIETRAHGRDAALYARFRAMIERDFRRHLPIGHYAAKLGVTADRLHEATSRTVGLPPLGVVHGRLILEARRALAYTTLTVAEIAFDLGFADPAYFSRFFTRRAGRSPSTFRTQSSDQPGRVAIVG